MKTDIELNTCVSCGEIWNTSNMRRIEFQGHSLLMCQDCVNDFYKAFHNDIIKEFENIKEFTEALKDNSKCKECDKQPYDVFISLCDKRIAELKGK